jgi:hypothetical protein
MMIDFEIFCDSDRVFVKIENFQNLMKSGCQKEFRFYRFKPKYENSEFEKKVQNFIDTESYDNQNIIQWNQFNHRKDTDYQIRINILLHFQYGGMKKFC